MPKSGEIDYVVTQLMLSCKSLRHEEEKLQDLEAHCSDDFARAVIREQWNALEAMQDKLQDFVIERMEAYRQAVDSWSLQTLKGEPTVADLTEFARTRRNGRPAPVARKRVVVGA
jgi:hypothetical protein